MSADRRSVSASSRSLQHGVSRSATRGGNDGLRSDGRASVILGIGAVTHVTVRVPLVRINESDASQRASAGTRDERGTHRAAAGMTPRPGAIRTGVTHQCDRPDGQVVVQAQERRNGDASESQQPVGPAELIVVGWVCSAGAGWPVYSSLSMDTTALGAAVVMLGTPTAVSTYVYTTELSGDAAFASLNVLR